MAYRQYTQCVAAKDHTGIAPAILAIVASALAAVALAAIAGALAVGAVALAVIAYCRWWLYDRLVCLGGDRCAIGMLLTVEPPENKSGLDRFDTDYSINLVLAPHRAGDSRATIEAGLQGELIKEQAATKNEGMDFAGYETRQWGNYPKTPVLHAEFEGGGVQTLYDAAKAAAAISAVGSAFCFIPIIGWIACLIAGAIAAGVLIGGIIAALNDKGNPNHVNPELGELHTNDPTGRGADILVVSGTWVYDSAHEGWNEIHPIKHCQRVGRWSGGWDIDAKAARDHWCDAIGQASSPLTHDNQQRPENQWTLHPVIDGCTPSDGGPIIK
jgi:hypothetical protein